MLPAALTILLSSFLLFLVQPIVAKEVLPWFGGSAGVWIVCLVFFQTVLVLGYAYAHFLTRQRIRPQALLHGALLLASCLALPIIPAAHWKNGVDGVPALQILGLLTTTVGLPYFLLASTSPLLQQWLSGAAQEHAGVRGRAIYRLFALSNLGSLLGLLCYPFAIEPYAPLATQAWTWSAAYALFVVCTISYAWLRQRRPELRQPPAHETDPRPAPGAYLFWGGCAALGSVLLLAVTNQITQNVASIPLLWVVPLSVYLFSFTVCFEGRAGRGWYERRFWVTPALIAAAAMAWALYARDANLSVYAAVPTFVIGLFLGCVICHGELARTKPQPRYLTHFYLSVAAGGALGGMLVGLAAPRVFSGYWEMPLALIALAALGLYCSAGERQRRPTRSWIASGIVALAITALVLLLTGRLPTALDPYALGWAKIVQGEARWGCAALVIVAAALLQNYGWWRALALGALCCVLAFDWNYYRGVSTDTEFAQRNFYGTLRVTEAVHGRNILRQLLHGTILHGSQFTQPPERDTPTTYYGGTSGIGRTIQTQHRNGPIRIASIGLGTGTLAVWAGTGDLFRVYELNPAVLEVAGTQFSYLRHSRARVETVLGDARLSLERELADGDYEQTEQRYDLLSLDAFSGDAIPVHLLTREAFATYARVLKPDGVIAFHVSNRYLNLSPVVARIARLAGFQAALVADRPHVQELTGSTWVLVTRNLEFLRQPLIAPAIAPIAPSSGGQVWTDEFSNLLHILK